MQHENRNLGFLVMAQALFLSTSVVTVSTITLVGSELSPSDNLVSLPYALVTVGTALSTIPVSFLMRRFGRRTIFLCALIIALLGFAAGFGALYWGAFGLLMISGLFHGMAQAATQYFRFAAVEVVSESRAGSAISWVLGGGIIAALFAPGAARLANQTYTDIPYSGSYIMMLMVGVVALLPILFLRVPKPALDENSGSGRPLREILSKPKTIAAMVAAGTGWLLMVMLMGAAPLAMHAKGFHFDHSSQVIQWHMLGMYVPSFFSAFLIGRLGITKLLLLGGVILFSAAAVGYTGESFYHFVASLILLGIGWNFMFVGGTTLLTQTYSLEEKAKVQGLNEFLIFAMATTGAFLSGFLVKTIGWQSLMIVAMIVVGVAISLVMALSLRYRRHEKAEAAAKSV